MTSLVLDAHGPFSLIATREVYYWRFRHEDSAPIWTYDAPDEVEERHLVQSYREVGIQPPAEPA